MRYGVHIITMPASLIPRNPSLAYVGRFLLLGVAYGAVAYLSLASIPPGPGGASLVWPVAAVGLAGLLFWGLNLWPALALSLFVTLMLRGYEPALAAGVTVGNTAESVAAAFALARLEFHPLMSRLRDSLALILVAFVTSFVSATVIAVSTALFWSGAFSNELWLGLWIGHAVSILSFGPFLVRWGHRPLFRKTWREILVGTLIFGSIALLSFFAFWTPHASVGGIPLLYLLVFPLIAASLRTGPRGISLALFLITTIGVSGVIWGYGPITKDTSSELFGVQMFIGALSLIFLLFTSTTEERKEAVVALEGHMHELEDEFEKVSSEDKAKSEFIAILAHELRNPLSPALSGLEILKLRERGSLEVHQMMGAHLNMLARLLDDLLDITRISQKKFTLKRETVKLQDVLDRSLEMALPHVAERRHAFTKDVAQEDLWVDADPVRLEQVFVNLLNNAAKYTQEGGQIRVSAGSEDGEVIVRVRDSGPGIAPERMGEIFEPFASGAQQNGSPGGLHIGLSLVKRMVELHEGRVEVVSEMGKGSEFIVRLPGSKTPPTVAADKKDNARERFSKEAVRDLAREAESTCVLVVDDNEAAASLLSTLLTHNKHRTVVAHTGEGALAEAERSRPNVVLLDIGLPDINGYEVAKRLRARFGGNLSIIAVTGYGQEEDREKAKQAGFDDHLVKPVSIVDVERVLVRLKKTQDASRA